jgi:hypothetical protein
MSSVPTSAYPGNFTLKGFFLVNTQLMGDDGVQKNSDTIFLNTTLFF